MKITITNLSTAIKAIEAIRTKAKYVDVYANDDNSFKWYFAVSGRINDMWFDYYIYKTDNGLTFEESSCSVIRPCFFGIEN